MNSFKAKKNLLIVASTYPRWANDHEPGFVHELSKRLTKDFTVTVICPHALGAKTKEVIDEVNIHRYQYAPSCLEKLVNDGGIVTNLRKSPWKLLLLPSFFLCQILAIYNVLKTKNIDVIHAHWLIPQGLALTLLSKITKIPPFIVTSHGADLFALKGKLFNYLKLFVVKNASQLTVVSSVMATELVKMGVDKEKIAVMPMGVNMDHFKLAPEIIRSKYEILFVGRLVEKKGLGDLLLALPEILKKVPEAYLTVVGFGPEESKLKAQALQLNIANKVNFVGYVTQDKLTRYYQSAAVFVAPFIEAKSGDQEGLGLVLVEALSCGCPVVVSNIPACRDVTCGMHGVYVFESQNKCDLSYALQQVLCAKPITECMVISNLSILKQKFSWSKVAAKYSHQLQKIINY